MKITKKGKSKFDESISKAVAEGETSIDLGKCGYTQLAHVIINDAEVDVNAYKLDKDQKEKEVTLKKKSLISARIKSLIRHLPNGSFNVSSKDGILSW